MRGGCWHRGAGCRCAGRCLPPPPHEGRRRYAYRRGEPQAPTHPCTASSSPTTPPPPSCPALPPRPSRSAYSAKKIQENVQCEIMHVIVEEATDSYRWVGGQRHPGCQGVACLGPSAPGPAGVGQGGAMLLGPASAKPWSLPPAEPSARAPPTPLAPSTQRGDCARAAELHARRHGEQRGAPGGVGARLAALRLTPRAGRSPAAGHPNCLAAAAAPSCPALLSLRGRAFPLSPRLACRAACTIPARVSPIAPPQRGPPASCRRIPALPLQPSRYLPLYPVLPWLPLPAPLYRRLPLLPLPHILSDASQMLTT